MEYIIILLLLIFLIIILLIKHINSIKKINNNKNKYKSIFKESKKNEYLYFGNNPILFYLYFNTYKSLQKFNKYDYKSYITFTKIKTSNNDQYKLDWISYTCGIIRMSIDNIKKNIKKKEKINNEFVKDITKLKLYYKLLYKYDDNNIKVSNRIKNNKILFDLYYINEILINIYRDYFNNLNNTNISRKIKYIIKNKNNDYYLYNTILNNKLDKKYLIKNISSFNKYFLDK